MRTPSTTEQLANAIEALVVSYVDEVRQAAEQALARALCRPAAAGRRSKGKRDRPATASSTTKRRTAAELDAACEQLCALVRARPGESILTLAEEWATGGAFRSDGQLRPRAVRPSAAA